MADSLEDTIVRLESAQTRTGVSSPTSPTSSGRRSPRSSPRRRCSAATSMRCRPTRRRTGELVVHDIGRLRVLVEDLMELSRFDAAGEEVRLQPIDLGRLLRDVARGPPARRGARAARRAGSSSRPTRAGSSGSSATSSTTPASTPPGALVVVRLQAARDEVRIAVLDRGPGVPPDRLGRIFERFYMADPSRRGGSAASASRSRPSTPRCSAAGSRATNRDGGGLEIELAPARDPTVTRRRSGGDPRGRR